MLTIDDKVRLEKQGFNLSNLMGKKCTCPKCSASRKKTQDKCVTINDDKTWKCHHCSAKGYFGEDDNESKSWFGKSLEPEITYVKPTQKLTKISDMSLDWLLEERKITKQTALDFKLAETFEGWISFPYLRNGEVLAVKFRNPRYIYNPEEKKKSKWKQEPSCEPFLFNEDSIKGKTKIIINEGEIDTVSFHQALKESGQLDDFAIVSLHSGACERGQEVQKKLIGLTKKWPEICKMEVYLALDGDDPGQYMSEIISSLLVGDPAKIITYPEGTKDANEVLKQFGNKGVLELIEKASYANLEDTFVLDDSTMEEYFRLIDSGAYYGKETGFSALDRETVDRIFSWVMGYLYIWTGKPGSGKSNFLFFLLLLKSLSDGSKWLIFTPESTKADLYSSLVNMLTGDSPEYIRDNVENGKEFLAMANQILERTFIFAGIEDAHYEDSKENKEETPEWISNIIKKSIVQHNIAGWVIDPWNQLVHSSGGKSYEYLSIWLKKFKMISKIHNLYGNIVAHPRGFEGMNKERCSVYHIAEGTMFNNKADVICVIDRPNYLMSRSDKGEDTVERLKVDFYVDKWKSVRRGGRIAKSEMRYVTGAGWYTEWFDEEEFLPDNKQARFGPMVNAFSKIVFEVTGGKMDYKSSLKNTFTNFPDMPPEMESKTRLVNFGILTAQDLEELNQAEIASRKDPSRPLESEIIDTPKSMEEIRKDIDNGKLIEGNEDLGKELF